MSENSSEIEKLEETVVRELCEDYAKMTRVNISEEHGQVSTLNLYSLHPTIKLYFYIGRLSHK